MIESLLERGLPALGVEPPAGAVERLDQYARLLLEKNQVMNLTAITEPEQVARLHMLDCAALLNVCDLTGKRLLDVGTGAGFPGMVLKILVPSLDVTLLDSLNKRLDWLAETWGALGLEGIRAVHARAEEKSHDPAFRERFDVVTSRAVAELRTLCELCLGYVRPGGVLLAMKSVDSGGELAAAETAIETLGGAVESVRDYEIPGTDVRHRVIVIKKISETPKKYPRPFAKIKKNPL
nr:16S rRNA (guanine(527)-N(7))-methyltransferase RsmG [uncultured Oscillibacter sp.]